MTTNFICDTCGIQFGASSEPPTNCPICVDERQFVNPAGQSWTTIEALRKHHHNHFSTVEPNLIGIHTSPAVAIGQRALLVRGPAGNVLWDATPLLDETTIAAVEAFGGIDALAVSHPHLCSNIVDWSHAFDNAPIYWHADDRDWVMRPDPAFRFWEGERQTVVAGIDLIRCGGHFPGSAVLHWAAGAQGRGVILTGDTMMIVADGHLSFMYSYPNRIPLSAREAQAVADAVAPYAFDRMYGAWTETVIADNAQAVLSKSIARFVGRLAQ